jgi:NTE family protein
LLLRRRPNCWQELANLRYYNVVQLVYWSATYEGQSKDYEFSRRTMEEHWQAGYDDATTTLAHPEIFVLPTTAQGVAVYDFLTPTAKNGAAHFQRFDGM